MLEKPAVSGGIAGAIASVLVAVVPPMLNYNSFNRNVVLEAVKASKSPADLEGVLKELCKRKYITDTEHCPT